MCQTKKSESQEKQYDESKTFICPKCSPELTWSLTHMHTHREFDISISCISFKQLLSIYKCIEISVFFNSFRSLKHKFLWYSLTEAVISCAFAQFQFVKKFILNPFKTNVLKCVYFQFNKPNVYKFDERLPCRQWNIYFQCIKCFNT